MENINSKEAFALAGIVILPYAIIEKVKEFREGEKWYFQHGAALRVADVKEFMEKYAIKRLRVIYTELMSQVR